jgi:hypothetical protein
LTGGLSITIRETAEVTRLSLSCGRLSALKSFDMSFPLIGIVWL